MPYDTEHLQRCRKLIEEKLGWPSADQWRDFEFAELSDKIFDSSSVQLSTTTLKRVFGKLSYKSLPSSATMNALAKYLGYENWMQFKSSQEIGKKEEPKEELVLETEKAGHRFSRKLIAAAAAILVLVIVCGFVFLCSCLYVLCERNRYLFGFEEELGD
ncbi:MAG: hypothetical protein ABI688_09535 [Bacteroidota bacterium]